MSGFLVGVGWAFLGLLLLVLVPVTAALVMGGLGEERDRLDALAMADDTPLTVSERVRFDEIAARL